MNYIRAGYENPVPSNAGLSLSLPVTSPRHSLLSFTAIPPLNLRLDLTKADSSKSSFWECLFHFELDTKLLFLTVELFSMLDTNILISCYLAEGEIEFYTGHLYRQGESLLVIDLKV